MARAQVRMAAARDAGRGGADHRQRGARLGGVAGGEVSQCCIGNVGVDRARGGVGGGGIGGGILAMILYVFTVRLYYYKYFIYFSCGFCISSNVLF